MQFSCKSPLFLQLLVLSVPAPDVLVCPWAVGWVVPIAVLWVGRVLGFASCWERKSSTFPFSAGRGALCSPHSERSGGGRPVEGLGVYWHIWCWKEQHQWLRSKGLFPQRILSLILCQNLHPIDFHGKSKCQCTQWRIFWSRFKIHIMKNKKFVKMSLLDADSMLNLPIERLKIRGKSASYPIGCRFGAG